ncbi:hypothetical protein BSLA_01f0904 [Burkholderia stabilis]|nr:hypothetical protein BSLA_01f0904 [Burkholderia stabilis]
MTAALERPVRAHENGASGACHDGATGRRARAAHGLFAPCTELA